MRCLRGERLGSRGTVRRSRHRRHCSAHRRDARGLRLRWRGGRVGEGPREVGGDGRGESFHRRLPRAVEGTLQPQALEQLAASRMIQTESLPKSLKPKALITDTTSCYAKPKTAKVSQAEAASPPESLNK